METTAVITALQKQGIKLVHYNFTTIADQQLSYTKIFELFKLQKKVHQGNGISTKLFIVVFEEVFKRIDIEARYLNLDREYLNNLSFVNDFSILFTVINKKIQEMLKELKKS